MCGGLGVLNYCVYEMRHDREADHESMSNRIRHIILRSVVRCHYFSISTLRTKRSTTIDITMVRRATTIKGAIHERSHEQMYKTDVQKEAKRLRATTLAFGILNSMTFILRWICYLNPSFFNFK